MKKLLRNPITRKLVRLATGKLKQGDGGDPCCCDSVCFHHYVATYTCATAQWSPWVYVETTCEPPDAHVANTRIIVSVDGEGDGRVGQFDYWIVAEGATCDTDPAGCPEPPPDPPATETGVPEGVCWQCIPCGDCCFSSEMAGRFQLAALAATGWVGWDCEPAPPPYNPLPAIPAIDVPLVRGTGYMPPLLQYVDPAFDPTTWPATPGLWKVTVNKNCTDGKWYFTVSYWFPDPNIGTVEITNYSPSAWTYQDCGLTPIPSGDCCGISGTGQLWMSNMEIQDYAYRKDGSYAIQVIHNLCCKDGITPCLTREGGCDGGCNPLP